MLGAKRDANAAHQELQPRVWTVSRRNRFWSRMLLKVARTSARDRAGRHAALGAAANVPALGLSAAALSRLASTVLQAGMTVEE